MIWDQQTPVIVPAAVVQRANGGQLPDGTDTDASMLPGTINVIYEAEGWGWTVEISMQCGGEGVTVPLTAAVFWLAPTGTPVVPSTCSVVAALTPSEKP